MNHCEEGGNHCEEEARDVPVQRRLGGDEEALVHDHQAVAEGVERVRQVRVAQQRDEAQQDARLAAEGADAGDGVEDLRREGEEGVNHHAVGVHNYEEVNHS